MSLDLALRVSGGVVAASLLFMAGEYLVLIRSGVFTGSGLLDWQVIATMRRWTTAGRIASFLDAVFSPKRFSLLIGMQLCLSLVLATGAAVGSYVVCGIACLVCHVIGYLLAVRHPFGRDGADEMLSLLLVGLGVAFLVPNQIVKLLAVLFVCIQLTLSYLVAGVAKARSSVWMRTGALGGILSTEIYGRGRGLGRWLRRHPRADVACSVGVVAMEIGYPLVFVVPTVLAVTYLGITFAFHFGAAVFMGLNTFLLVFCGAIVLMYWLVTTY